MKYLWLERIFQTLQIFFCKELEIEENEFYQHYSSLKHIEASFWKEITAQTVATIHGSEQTENKSISHDLLTFYFTLFENLTLNRSYVLHSLENQQSKLFINKELRKDVFPHLQEIAGGIETLAHKLSDDIGNKINGFSCPNHRAHCPNNRCNDDQ